MKDENTISINDEILLLKELDKGIDDMENGRVTSHEISMEILRQQYNNYVVQNS